MGIRTVRSPIRRTVWISLLLFLILGQMLISMQFSAGVFILSDQSHISPFARCQKDLFGVLSCDNTNMFLVVCLYSPLVLVAFALLASLFAVYGRDGAVLRFSAILQAASSVLLLLGLCQFLCLHRRYVHWNDMTPEFYICVVAEVELMVSTVLTWKTCKMLTPDWQ